jgi:hypothetical protein
MHVQVQVYGGKTTAYSTNGMGFKRSARQIRDCRAERMLAKTKMPVNQKLPLDLIEILF